MRSRWPARILSASLVWKLAMMAMIGASTPAVSHVAASPGVARLDEVAGHDAHPPDAGPPQAVGQHRAQGAAAAQRHPAGQQALLAGAADAREAHLPAVPLQGGGFAHGLLSPGTPKSAR